ncbi:MAG: PBP1A family penicillin-binding protein [Patescibacteria group bacterium]
MTYNPRRVKSPRPWRGKARRRQPLFSLPKIRIPHLKIPFQGLKAGALIRTLFLFVTSAVLLGGIIFIWLLALFSRNLPNPDRFLERAIPLSTKIYDRTGKTLLYDIHGSEKRTLVELPDISPLAKWAAIAAEDRSFYEHSGFDIKGIVRSVLIDILRGGKAQGGSTITQQLVKNAVLTREKTYSRKLKELIMAYQLEKQFSKDQILKMYFNEIPYGSTVYGIEAASFTFFNKSAKTLDLGEAALLAALPQAPSYLSPYGSHTDELEKRARYIIGVMAEEKYISAEDAERAQKEDLLKKFKARQDNLLAPHFSLFIKDLLMEKYGDRLIEEGGLRITTTLDWDLQQIAEEEVRKGAENNEKKYSGGNAALVSLDPKSGQVLALVGSRDYFDEEHDGAVNVVMRPRQPGSSFKPIVYAAAFAKGYTPETTLYDVETVFKNYPTDYTPHNYDGKEHGPVSMRKALAGSLNIPAVKTLYLAGVDTVLNLAEKMGYSTLKNRSRFGLSLVLGGAEVKLLDHAAGYAVLANEGVYVPPSFILRVEDGQGNVLEEWEQPAPKKVLEKQAVRLVTNILSDNDARAYVFGTQNPLTLPDRPVAAKTGTTNDWHDGWLLGYTPSLVTGVWTGNNDNKEMKRGADGSYTAGPIWNAFMQKALKSKPVETFTPPEKEDIEKPILRGEGTGQIKVVIDTISKRRATEWTPLSLRAEHAFQEPHSILYFVGKNDPRGPQPSHPEDDPQFRNWEDGVLAWAKKQKITMEQPPVEDDNIHLPEYRPAVSLISPTESAVLSAGSSFTISVQASAPRGVRSIKIFLDETFLGELLTPNLSGVFSLPGSLSPGPHTLSSRAYDDVLNEGEAHAVITVSQ